MTCLRSRALVVALATIGLAAAAAWQGGRLLAIDVPVMGPEAIVPLASHEWERLPEAARLARDNPHAVVLLTQPARPTPLNCHDCPHRVGRLVALGVPPERIKLLTRGVTNTYDEALAVRAYMQQTGIHRVLVVTSRYHTRRALGVFRHALRQIRPSVGVVGAPWPEASPERWWASPYGRWYVTREWAAILYYSLRHSGFLRQVPFRPW